MIQQNPATILFTGYAPVHFVCFRPLYERLIKLAGTEVFVSGGIRTKIESGYSYDGEGMYRSFKIPGEQILSVDEIREREFDALFAANTKLIAPLRAGITVQMFHGISFRNRAIREENMGCDYYFLIGPYMKRRFARAGLLRENDARALEIGFPKTDPLKNGTLSRADLLHQYGFDGSRPVMLYAPTGERHNSLETMGEDVIRHLAKSDKFDLLVKPHDHIKNTATDWFSQLRTFENSHMRLVRSLDVIPILFAADLLITDASSVAGEFSLLDRPIVFLDVPKLIQKTARREGSMLDLQCWGRRGGVLVKKPDEITLAVEYSLTQPRHFTEIRRAMASDLFFNPGSATDVAFAWVCDTLDIGVRPAGAPLPRHTKTLPLR